MTTESQEKQEPIKVVQLEHPITFGSKEIKSVSFLRRPKAKDMKGVNLQAMSTTDTMKVLANITDLSTPELEEVDLDDFSVLGEALISFLPNTRRIGQERSAT